MLFFSWILMNSLSPSHSTSTDILFKRFRLWNRQYLHIVIYTSLFWIFVDVFFIMLFTDWTKEIILPCSSSSLLTNNNSEGDPLDWSPLPIISTGPPLIDSQFVPHKIHSSVIDSQFVPSITSSIFRNKKYKNNSHQEEDWLLRILLCMYRVFLLTTILPLLVKFFLLWVMLLFTSFTSSNYCLRSKNISIISRKSGEFNCANGRKWKMLLTTI